MAEGIVLTRLARLRALVMPAAAALALVASGCATEAPDEPVTGEVPTAEAATAERTSAPETSATSEAPTPAEPTLIELSVGEAFTTDRGSTITVHEVRTNIPFEFESEDGGAWHAIDAEYCLSDILPELESFQSFTYGWVLRTEEGYMLDYPGSSWDGIVSPALDLYSVTPGAGECYRGWILIDGPPDVNVTSARFYEIDWRVS